MANISDFDEIRPYNEGEMGKAFHDLVNDRQFKLVLKSFAPWIPGFLRHGLLRLAFIGINKPLDFQLRFMKPVVRMVLRKCSDGCTFIPDPANTWNKRYVFMSNHRDIVLDSAILDLKLVESGAPTTCEIAIGDNLLIYPWIKNLVRMNKAFTVRRSLTPKEMMKSSILMSEYIHYAINEKKENVWIAQREGRAKDSNDRTQESVLKMLALGGDSGHEDTQPTQKEMTHVESLKDIHIVPLTISYEYDPCDYLKAKEFQQKRDDPKYKKSRQDDLDNMKTGILGYKGHIYYTCSPCIDSWLDTLQDYPVQDFYTEVAHRIDHEIHSHYHLFPNNYIALDTLNGNYEFASHYTSDDKQRFEAYLKQQLAKIDLPNKDDAFLRERMLTMYANPLRNFIAATSN